MSIEDKFKKRWEGMVKEIVKKEDVHTIVGIFESKREDGESNVMVGSVHEFGINTPERSFLRRTIDSNRSKYKILISKAAKKIMNIVPAKKIKEMADIGKIMEEDVKNTIEEIGLVQTGQLMRSVEHKEIEK